MKRVIAFIILCSSFVILLCPDANAQWDGAQAQQLTDNDLPDKIVGLYIDAGDQLHLFYAEGVRDTLTGAVYDYRLVRIAKEKGGDWSEPQDIQTPEYIIGQNRKSVVGFDAKTGKTHILYYGWAFYDTLYYTNSDTPDWEFMKIDSLGPGHQYVGPDVEVDSLGNVHLVWYESYWSGGSWARFWYANNSTAAWVKQPVSPPIYLGVGGTWAPLLAVEANGTAHVTYGGAGVSECYYVRNDSLNSENWETDTIPRPSIPLCSHRYQELLAGPSERIHLFTRGYSCTGDTIFQFYYHKQGGDTLWSEASLVQVHPPDSGLIEDYFVDQEGHVHLSLSVFGGFNVYYTNNNSGSWSDPELLLYEYDAVGAGSSFRFVMDSYGQGHGVFIGYKYHGGIPDEDSTEVFYFASTTSVEDTLGHRELVSFRLYQNYPNPFNSNTVIRYELDSAHPVTTTLKVYDVLGREVRQLVNTRQSRGSWTIVWDGKDNCGKEVASGIYFCLLRAGERKEGKKLLLTK
jgi:hypothetical protein